MQGHPSDPPRAVETPEETRPGAGIPSCAGSSDTRRLARGTVAAPWAAAATFALGESQGRTGVGEQRDSARLRNSYFPVAWTSRWPRRPPPAAAGPLARGRVARGKRQSQLLSSPGGKRTGCWVWGADPPEQLSRGVWVCNVQPGARLCSVSTPSSRTFLHPACALTLKCPAPHKSCNAGISFPKHAPCGHCRSSAAPGPGGQHWAPRPKH